MEKNVTNEKGKIFLIPSRKIIRIINQNDISFIRAESNYSVFVMDDKTEWTFCHTLDFVEKTLGQSPFFRCHKSYLVNLIKIKELSRKKTELVLIHDLRLPVSRRKRKEFINSLCRINCRPVESQIYTDRSEKVAV